MTKKHFIALAAAIKKMEPKLDTFEYTEEFNGAHIQWVGDGMMVADVCARFNPNFDRARFLAACGVEV